MLLLIYCVAVAAVGAIPPFVVISLPSVKQVLFNFISQIRFIIFSAMSWSVFTSNFFVSFSLFQFLFKVTVIWTANICENIARNEQKNTDRAVRLIYFNRTGNPMNVRNFLLECYIFSLANYLVNVRLYFVTFFIW